MDRGTRYLILGGGAVVSELHLPAFAGLGWMDRVRVVDPSPLAAEVIARGYPQAEFVRADFRDAIARARDDGFAAALVALPNALHEEAVDRALDSRLDVLCEKPLALTEQTCERLAAKASRLERVLGVAMVRRFAPAVRAARNAIAAGWLGDIESVDMQWGGPFAWPAQSGAYFRSENGGVLANLGVHSLDMADFLFGSLEPVSYADDWGGGAEANATYTLRTGSGASVTIGLSYTTELSNLVTIRGSLGELQFDHDATTARFHGRESGIDASVTLSHPFEHGDWPPTLPSWFFEQLSAFDRAIRRRGRPPATGDDAVRIARLIDWAYAHHRTTIAGRMVARTNQTNHGLLSSGRIVVTGGTGFVGGHLIERLVADGHDDLVLPVRSYRSGANAGRFRVELVPADLLDRPRVQHALHGARYVFHLAYGRDGQDAGRVTVDGTKHVVEAAIAAGAEAVVVVSTTSVFGNPGGELDETAAYLPGNDYERLKAQAEQWTLTRAASSGRTRIAVVNAACVYGPHGRMFTEMPARFLRDGNFCWIEDGRGLVNYVYVQNLVDALVRAAACRPAHGHRFIASDGVTTWRDFFTRLLGPAVDDLPSYTRAELDRLAGSRTPRLRDLGRAVVGSPEVWRVIRTNPRLSRIKTLARAALPTLTNRVKATRDASTVMAHTSDRALPPPWLADLYGPASTRLSSAKARRVLGWDPAMDLDAGMAHSREWLRRIALLPEGSDQ
jgi:predicted dehydrogenase/nucleoside-diphosphate-sugar epimerase